MIISKRGILPALIALFFAATAVAQVKSDGHYRKEMKALQAVIQTNFYDKASGEYFVVVDSAERERKNGYLRQYTYLWSYCAMYRAANEIEKLEPKANLMAPMLKLMYAYYNPAPPHGGFTDYIMKLQPGERYYDDNEWIGITALDAYTRTKKKADFDLG
ncbi:hypothetical protein HK413_04040 [Mucilaginibacter sp. S1162]|uniref:Glycoside hydrolase family 88 protein n=1 Tax=Mucilaginibacter humi TaxID=2732510 RepID=A0ABX1VZZ1_9SPHI|nr:hypothetical protein [Mucilaginibacter humi]NNU33522.1 hypothetical protein [Mucilaginibacter humi]